MSSDHTNDTDDADARLAEMCGAEVERISAENARLDAAAKSLKAEVERLRSDVVAITADRDLWYERAVRLGWYSEASI